MDGFSLEDEEACQLFITQESKIDSDLVDINCESDGEVTAGVNQFDMMGGEVGKNCAQYSDISDDDNVFEEPKYRLDHYKTFIFLFGRA